MFLGACGTLAMLSLLGGPKQLRADGPPLDVDFNKDVARVPAQADIDLANIEAVECVSFVLAAPVLTRRGKSTHSYTWGSHIVLRLVNHTRRYVPIAYIGSNMRRSARRTASRLSVPYAWTHLGILETTNPLLAAYPD